MIKYFSDDKQRTKLDTKKDMLWYWYGSQWREITWDMMDEAIRQSIDYGWKRHWNPGLPPNITDWRAIELKVYPSGRIKS